MTFSTVLAIMHGSHEDTSATFGSGTLAPQPFDLAVAIHFVVFEHRQLGLLPLVLDFLWCRIDLLLSLLCAAAET